MTGAPGRTPTLSGSSGGWVRASGLRVFSAALLPPELHRNEQETLVGVEPTSCDFADRRLASRPQDHSEPAVGLEPTSSALRGRCPARRASPASFSSSQCWCRANSTGVQSPCPLPRAWPEIQSQRRDSNPHAPLYRRGARPAELHWRSEQGWVVGYDPAPRRSQGRMQRHYTIPTISKPTSIPVRNRT
jgi:hypothetical protein